MHVAQIFISDDCRLVWARQVQSKRDQKCYFSSKFLLKVQQEGLQSLFERGKQTQKEREKEIEQIELNHRVEIENVNDRVKRLIENKQRQAHESLQKLHNLKEEEDKLQKIIDKTRAEKILR